MKTQIYTPCHFEAGILHDAVIYMDVCDFKGKPVRIYNKTDFACDKLAAIQYLAKYIERNELPDYTDAASYDERIKEWTDDIEEISIIQNFTEYKRQVGEIVSSDFAMSAGDVDTIIVNALKAGEDPTIPAKTIAENCRRWCDRA